MSFRVSIWSTAGLAHVKGHSFRIRGAVELLLAGVPPEIVAAMGGWTSPAFLLYWRRMEEIIPMSTSKAYQKSQITDLAKFLEDFRQRNKIPAQLLDASEDRLLLAWTRSDTGLTTTLLLISRGLKNFRSLSRSPCN